MFSGLIAHLGRVASVDDLSGGGRRLVIAAPDAMREGVAPKDSIAINGVCLTVVAHGDETAAFDVVPETLARSTLGTLRAGDPVNVELSLRLGDRLGGHLVYGHVDATALLRERRGEGQGERLVFAMPGALARFIVEKGYVALDGVSLTIAAATNDRFEIALIPETATRTTFGARAVGDRVNVEVDPIARYAVAAVEATRGPSSPSAEEIAWAYEI